MKKQLALAAGLAVLAAPAFATKARLNALGEDQYGSYYVKDNRNMFLNAAAVNGYKDFVTMEWGNTKQTAGNNGNDADTVSTPKAEGGAFFGHGNMVYGVYLGAESNTAAAFRSWASTNGAATSQNNNVDLFIGGDAGIKWGANIEYGKTSKVKNASGGNGVDDQQDMLLTRLGVDGGMWQAFANISLVNKAKTAAGGDFKGKTGFQLGGSYNLNDYVLFAEWRHFKGDDKANDTTAKVDMMMVGAGRQTKLNDKATLFTKASFQYAKGDNDGASNLTINNDINNVVIFSGDKTTKAMALPVTIGLEYDAASWLVWRGSVSQVIYNSYKFDGDETGSLANNTIVRAGAGLKFGDMTVDGVIGNDNNGSTQGSNTSSGAGGLRTDQLMSRVAVSYKW